jgi:uncharacterized membrane protein YdjX (TVP38/TMEM64 family)
MTEDNPATAQSLTIRGHPCSTMRYYLSILAGPALVAIIVWCAPASFYYSLADACDWIQQNTMVGALLFIPVEVLWVISCVPTTPLELAAGYAFGLEWGFVVDSVGKLLGCVASFWIGRFCLQGVVERSCLGSSSAQLLRAVDHALGAEGVDSTEAIQLLLLIQLAYIPVSIKNYGLSITSVSFSRFFITALFGEIPGTLAVVWAGASTHDLVGLLTGRNDLSTAQVYTTIFGSGCLLVSMVVLGIRIKRRLTQVAESADARRKYP